MRLPPFLSGDLLRQFIDCSHLSRLERTPREAPVATIISLKEFMPQKTSWMISRHHLSPIWSSALLMELARVTNLFKNYPMWFERFVS